MRGSGSRCGPDAGDAPAPPVNAGPGQAPRGQGLYVGGFKARRESFGPRAHRGGSNGGRRRAEPQLGRPRLLKKGARQWVVAWRSSRPSRVPGEPAVPASCPALPPWRAGTRRVAGGRRPNGGRRRWRGVKCPRVHLALRGDRDDWRVVHAVTAYGRRSRGPGRERRSGAGALERRRAALWRSGATPFKLGSFDRFKQFKIELHCEISKYKSCRGVITLQLL